MSCTKNMQLANHARTACRALAVTALVAAVALLTAAPGEAQVINEWVANHTGIDTHEYVEIYGTPSTDYSALRIVQIEGDTVDGPGNLDTAIQPGTTDANGLWYTGFLDNILHNGTMTLLLVEGFSGTVDTDLDTNDDGVLDTTPWTTVVDSVAVTDGDTGDLTYAGPVLYPNYDGLSWYSPGGASRIPDGADTDAMEDWRRNDFDGAGLPGYTGQMSIGEAYNTPGTSNDWLPPSPPVINEVVTSHDGTDDHEYVELEGMPLVDYSADWLLVLSGDAGATGQIDRVYQVGTSDVNGYWTTGLLTDELANGSLTILLVSGFTGSAGDDLDTNDDGALDTTPWDELYDSVSISDGDAADLAYSSTVLDPSLGGFAVRPGGASRIPDGLDTDTVSDWQRNDTALSGINGYPATPALGYAFNTPAGTNRLGIIDYYAEVDPTDQATLRATLHEAIDDHKRFAYTADSTDTWDILEQADENPSDAGAVITVYRNATYAKQGGGNTFYNREHRWPKSYGFPDDEPANYPYTDCHHLMLSNDDYNTDRSNRPYGTCDASCTERPTEVNNGVGGGTGVYPGNSNWYSTDTWEVWNHRRGDVARALLYMDVRYEGDTHSVTGAVEPDLQLTDNLGQIVVGQPYMGLLSVLLTWSQEDPVDDEERARNEVVFRYQGNRNPFVDHPGWIDCIFLNQGCGTPIFTDDFETGDMTRWSASSP